MHVRVLVVVLWSLTLTSCHYLLKPEYVMFTHGRHFQGAFCLAKQPSSCHANKIRSNPCPGFVVQHVKLRKWFLYPEEKTQVLMSVARKKSGQDCGLLGSDAM